MTWHTPSGDRYLQGAEARLFRAALRSTIEELEMDFLNCSGTLLARQTRKARLHLFAYVGNQLLRPTDELPSLNAWTEGAVGLVYRRLNEEIQIELDLQEEGDPGSYYWRTLIVDASEEVWDKTSDVDKPLDVRCNDYGTWTLQTLKLEDRLLWDRDWEVVDDFHSQSIKDAMGIDGDYFDWNRVLFASNKEAVKLLGDLCGFRRGDFEGESLP